ncbi:hypothetical protein HOD88_02490 [archaeon]|jgi:membrane-associated protease RseP (regulator of RpoE activity)|nr:hypothetical protein [archaeon]
MLSKNEIISILVVTLILGFILSLLESTEAFLYSSLTIFAVIMTNVFAKKVASYYLDSEIEIRIWEMKRFGFKPKSYWKKPVQMGAFLPVILKFLSAGTISWLAVLSFDVKPKVYRATKRYGTYAFSEMTEHHIGLIAVWGILANFVIGAVGYLLGYTEFTKLSIYYAAFNLIPFSDLDGNKIFFGSLIWWTFLIAIAGMGLVYALLII